MSKDPVCERALNEQEAPERMQYANQTYYFCSATCRQAFEMDPRRYVDSPIARKSA